MVLDPDVVTDNDAGVALQFVVNGGRLVIGGDDPNRYLSLLRDRPPHWTVVPPNEPGPYTDVQPPFTDVRAVTTNEAGSFDRPGTSSPVVGTASNALVTRERVGRGEMLFVADVSPLTNDLLATTDNAAFGLALAGADGQPVVFDEGVHGYGQSRGIAAIPTRWKLTLAGLALAGLVLVWARGRRLGPPEDTERALAPPRREYVDALAATLERTQDREKAIVPVRAAVHRHVARRAGLANDASYEEFARAAALVGLEEQEVRVVVHGAANDDDVVTAGRALARLERWDTGRDE
jgi:hypothetical protein